MSTSVFPQVAGAPIRSGIMYPEIWSPKLLQKFYLATVYAEIANTDYEGEITAKGDTVHVRTTPDIQINEYIDGQPLEYQNPRPNVVDFVIDKGKYWAFNDTYVQRKQSDYAYVDDWTTDASAQMKIQIDKGLLATTYANAATGNYGATAGKISAAFNLGVSGTPLEITKANVIDFIQDMGSVLDEQDVPEEQRWMTVPTWFVNLIGKSDLKDASLAGDSVSIARNGRVGMIDRFTIYRSNQIATNVDGAETVFNVMAGHPCAISFASQLTESEGPMKHPNHFGDYYRGLQVYAHKVMKGEALAWGYVYK